MSTRDQPPISKGIIGGAVIILGAAALATAIIAKYEIIAQFYIGLLHFK